MKKSVVSRILAKSDIKKWIAAKKPLLKPEHAKKHLAFTAKYKDSDENEWRSVIFSDECSLERGFGARPTWVFRTPT